MLSHTRTVAKDGFLSPLALTLTTPERERGTFLPAPKTVAVDRLAIIGRRVGIVRGDHLSLAPARLHGWQMAERAVEASMTQVEQLASFVVRASYDDLSATAIRELKGRVLDALGCAVAALDAEPMRMLSAQLDEFGGVRALHLDRRRPDRSRSGGALQSVPWCDTSISTIRIWPPGEACHPSDNLGAVLAAAEYAGHERPGTSHLPGRSLPGSMPAVRRCAGASQRIRSRNPRGLCGGGRSRPRTWPGRSPRCPRPGNLWDRLQCPAGNSHRRPFALEGPGLCEYRLCRDTRHVPGHARHHRPLGGLRGEQGFHGDHCRAVHDRLAARRPGDA